ncbi:MAG: hypothetical protein KF708_09055 [Pirellulales bacterium]|nr:hypothetical protein [Pirellulales bacterium]
MKILYLHGLGSGPEGYKPTWLRGQGLEVVAPQLVDDDLAASIEIARRSFASQRFDVVVGSSRGGAVALALDTSSTPRVVIAPAWRRLGVDPVAGPVTVILHSPHDELIPLADSRELAARWQLPADSLLEVGARHTMSDPAALAALLEAVRRVAVA